MATYVIWSSEHTAWWRPHRCGYTRDLRDAGVYGEQQARDILQRANLVACHEALIPVDAVKTLEADDLRLALDDVTIAEILAHADPQHPAHTIREGIVAAILRYDAQQAQT